MLGVTFTKTSFNLKKNDKKIKRIYVSLKKYDVIPTHMKNIL
jgi:hypothetical protein